MDAHPFTTLSPPDAATAVRSFPRRFREAAAAAASPSLDEELTDEERDEIALRRGVDGWSAVDHLAAAAARLAAADRELGGALVRSDHAIDAGLLRLDPGASPGAAAGLDAAVAVLEDAARSLAARIDGADASGWEATRTTTDGTTATPLAVLQAAVAFTLDRLKGLERVLREVRGRPR